MLLFTTLPPNAAGKICSLELAVLLHMMQVLFEVILYFFPKAFEKSRFFTV
jgi:hypothetical protein